MTLPAGGSTSLTSVPESPSHGVHTDFCTRVPACLEDWEGRSSAAALKPGADSWLGYRSSYLSETRFSCLLSGANSKE